MGATADNAAAPVTQPPQTSAAAAFNQQSNFTAAVPTAAPDPSQTQSANAGAPVADAVVGPNVQAPSPPSVTLTAPAFIGAKGAQVVVQAQANGSNNALNPQVDIDVDLRHDGSFNDPGDQNYAVGQLNANGTASITVPAAAGLRRLHHAARVTDLTGDVGVSATATVVADPTAGVVGSEPLLDLAYNVPYGTDVTPNGPVHVPPVSSPISESDFSFLEFNSQGQVLVGVHSTLTQYLDGLESYLESHLGFTPTLLTPAQNLVTGWLPVNRDPEPLECAQL